MIILYTLQRDAPSVYGEAPSRTAAGTGVLEFPVDESSATAKSELRGKIGVDLVSMEPSTEGFEFNVDTTEPFSPERPGEQIQGPVVRVANHSAVPVKAEISQVAEIGGEDIHFSPKFGSGSEQKFQLLDRVSKVGDPGTAILVPGASGVSYSNKADFEWYIPLPGRRDIFMVRIETDGNTDLSLYGRISPDFYGEYGFAVSLTLKISTVNATD